MFTFHKGELFLIDKNCLHQEILDGSSATVIFPAISNAMFDDIMDEVNRISQKVTSSERIMAFLNTALMEQKSLPQYLYFQLQPDTLPVMEDTLLTHTNWTIDRIANEVGYHNKGYFYKIFTELCRLTPAQFRKKMYE